MTVTADTVTRLRDAAETFYNHPQLMLEAADELEAAHNRITELEHETQR